MSHWTKAAVLTVGLAAGIGAGVAWTSSPSLSSDGQGTVNALSRVLSPDATPLRNEVSAPSGFNNLKSSPSEDLLRSFETLNPESLEAETSDTVAQTVDVFVAQAPRQSTPDDEDSRSQSAPGDNAAPLNNDGEAATLDEEQTPDAQAPIPETSPQPQFSPVTPRPLGDRSTADPAAEIRAIRREVLQLLNRLEELEARLASGDNASAPNSPDSNSTASNSSNSNPSDSNSATDSGTAPAPQSSQPATPFFDGPPPPQLSLGTQTISLPGDVLFDFNRSDIRPEAASMLEQVAGILESMPYSHIQVAGHTDDVGDSNYNLVLSVERATAVQEFLKDALPDGGQGYRWTSTGYGEVVPVADNDTEEGRQRNRRVDLIVSPQ